MKPFNLSTTFDDFNKHHKFNKKVSIENVKVFRCKTTNETAYKLIKKQK